MWIPKGGAVIRQALILGPALIRGSKVRDLLLSMSSAASVFNI